LKISRTKKKLSDRSIENFSLALAGAGLGFIFTAAVSLFFKTHDFGVVSLEMPVLSEPINDIGTGQSFDRSDTFLRKTTPVVVMTLEEFYIGDLDAFTTDLEEIRNKYVVHHVDGFPQMHLLLKGISAWKQERWKRAKIKDDGYVIFLPTSDLPISVVTHVIDGLKRNHGFNRVVLASGLL